jgi:hypothetical protein
MNEILENAKVFCGLSRGGRENSHGDGRGRKRRVIKKWSAGILGANSCLKNAQPM